jgi:hypothetical protein
MKAFAIFAVLCFENPQSDIGMSCVNFWEDPMVYYKNERKCLDASTKKGNKIEIEFELQNIKIKDFIMWCIPVTKKVDL